jgi:5-methylcytosine-specific restriction endonuclease McrA
LVAAFEPMREAMVLADGGQVDESVELYEREVPDRQLNEWYDLHAQWVYKWRCNARGIPEPHKIPEGDRDRKLGDPDGTLPRQVYARDSYRCRYCGLDLFAIPAFKRFQRNVGPEVFPISKTHRNKDSAGACLVFRPVADHVEPWSRGGRTDLDNLVTACWPCNFGKMEYTVEELGISDPRTRSPVATGWDGLRTPLV